MASGELRILTKEFSVATLKALEKSQNAKSTSWYVMSNQIARSATSIGANVYEAQYAQGNADFVSKMEIALKECNESDYWLDIMLEMGCISEEDYNDLKSKCGLIKRMLIKSITTVKGKTK